MSRSIISLTEPENHDPTLKTLERIKNWQINLDIDLILSNCEFQSRVATEEEKYDCR